MRRRRLIVSIVAALTSTAVAACGSDDETASTSPESTPATPGVTQPTEQDLLAVATAYADGVAASYQASIASAVTLQEAIGFFVAEPTDETLAAAKEQWLAARDDYGPTEAFRLYDGPIDNPETGPEGQINVWPLDEAYIDYVDGNPEAGIINNPADFPEIMVDVLVGANEEGGETNISTGWHAIEFLLWGQDLDPQGPGNRPVTDYTDDPNALRRGTYLQLLAQLLVDDLNFVNDQWDAASGEYRKEFLADPSAAIQLIFRGIGALSSGELAGERMVVAYETKDQEDEHSCFSDNTNADIRNNAAGIRMVYTGQFPGSTSDATLSSLVAKVDPALDATLRAQLDTSVALVEAFPATFETMIQADASDPANQAFLASITSIEGQGDNIAAAAAALGITISLEV